MLPALPSQAASSNLLKISSVSDWNQFANNVDNGNSYEGYLVVLTDDLDFSNQDITMAGSYTDSFAGTFDGRGHTFKNVTKISNNYRNFALFYLVTGTVSNINMDNIRIECGGAGICLEADEGALIDNCHIQSGNIITNTSTGVSGGIVQKLYKATIQNCSNSASIASDCYIGGIVGEVINNNNSRIINCYNFGDISGIYNAYSGGICGWASETTEFINCYNAGKVSGKEGFFGAICGMNGIALNCYMLEGASSVTMNSKKQTEVISTKSQSEMKTQSFADELNKNLRDGCRKWVCDSGNYPEVDDTINPIVQKISGKTTYSLASPSGSKKISINASAYTKLSYKVTSGKKYIKVNKKGVVTIKKNTKPGTYKIKVTAASDDIFKKATKTIKIKVS